MGILSEVCFGKYYFEVAVILRNSLLLSNPVKEDWFLTVMEDLESLKIHETIKKIPHSGVYFKPAVMLT